jgi:hypothetical protein
MREAWMSDEGVPFVRTRLRAKRRKEGGKWLPTAPYRTVLAGGHAAPNRPAYEGPRGIPHVTEIIDKTRWLKDLR